MDVNKVIDDSKQAPIHILAAKYGGVPISYKQAHPEIYGDLSLDKYQFVHKLNKTIWAYEGINVDMLLNKLIDAKGTWISYTEGHNVKGDAIYVFPEELNLNAYKEVVSIYNSCIKDYVDKNNLNISLENLDISLVEPKIDGIYMGYDQPANILFRKYYAGTVMPYHEDSVHREYGGGFTAILYLNEDYVGGELFFKDDKVKFKPTKGSLIIFPGDKMHEILPLEEGNRYMISAYFFKDRRPDALKVSQEGYGSNGSKFWLNPTYLPGNLGNIKHDLEENNYKKPTDVD